MQIILMTPYKLLHKRKCIYTCLSVCVCVWPRDSQSKQLKGVTIHVAVQMRNKQPPERHYQNSNSL